MTNQPETPRTNQNMRAMMDGGYGAVINPEFAKQLEIELTALRRENEKQDAIIKTLREALVRAALDAKEGTK